MVSVPSSLCSVPRHIEVHWQNVAWWKNRGRRLKSAFIGPGCAAAPAEASRKRSLVWPDLLDSAVPSSFFRRKAGIRRPQPVSVAAQQMPAICADTDGMSLGYGQQSCWSMPGEQVMNPVPDPDLGEGPDKPMQQSPVLLPIVIFVESDRVSYL